MNKRDRSGSFNRAPSGGQVVYGLGLVGALVYFMSTANGVGSVIVGSLNSA